MFRKNNDAEVTIKKIPPSVISSDINLLGNIISSGLIDFDGNIDGNIECHTLVVRQNARINGEIKAGSVQISGRVFGTIRAAQVNVLKTAHIEGTVIHEHIIIEDGATVDGKLKKINKTQQDNSPMLMVPNMSQVDMQAREDEEDMRIMEHIRLIASNN